MKPSWVLEAEKHLGLKETPGDGKHNPTLKKMWDYLGIPFSEDERDWCKVFASYCLEKSGYKTPPKTIRARSFLDWGKGLDKPKLGCIVVFWRTAPDSPDGHVAFYLGEDSDSIKILGGNQGNAVTIENRDKKYLLGYRWPTNPEKKQSCWEKLFG